MYARFARNYMHTDSPKVLIPMNADEYEQQTSGPFCRGPCTYTVDLVIHQEGLLFRGALPARLMYISARSGLTMEPMVDLPIWNEWVIPRTGKNTGKPFV